MVLLSCLGVGGGRGGGALELDEGHAHKEDEEGAPFEFGELPAKDEDREESCGQDLELIRYLEGWI